MLIVEVTSRHLETILLQASKPPPPPKKKKKKNNIYIYIYITKLKGLKHFSRLNGWGISFSLSPKQSNCCEPS